MMNFYRALANRRFNREWAQARNRVLESLADQGLAQRLRVGNDVYLVIPTGGNKTTMTGLAWRTEDDH